MNKNYIQTKDYFIVEYSDGKMVTPVRIFYSSKEKYEAEKREFEKYENSEEYKKFERDFWYGKDKSSE